ncbi:MAG: saccharopine dehydrogenase family protein [Anaerovoracaceae bacterium]
MKKILILGVGAQGSAAAQRLFEEKNVSEIICADYDEKAVDTLVKNLKERSDKKFQTVVKGAFVDAHHKDSIVKAATLEDGKSVDLILNGLPLECTKNVLDAALEVKANYQDYAATTSLDEDWVESIRIMYDEYGPKFQAIGRLALIGTGSAPGLICAATRDAMHYLDTCDTIYNIVWEGVITKKFLPFWWSPITALNDMSEEAYAVIDDKLVRTEAFGLTIKRKYDYMDQEITFAEHCHDEPIHYFFNRKKYFKGAKNIYFKYAGAGMDFAKPLYEAGLLQHQPQILSAKKIDLLIKILEGKIQPADKKFSEKIRKEAFGKEIMPFNFALSLVPPAPKFKEEIEEILAEGLVSDSGCMCIEAFGKKDGKDVKVETHVSAPGLVESYEKSGITAEMYLTGQGGYLFSKMFVEDKFHQKGLISSDMLSMEQVRCYFDYAKDLGITLETKVIGQ